MFISLAPRKLARAMLLLLFPLLSAAWGSANVAILKTANLAPYNEAVDGIEQILGNSVTVYDMHGSEELGTRDVDEAKSNGVDLIISVGWKATQVALDEAPDIPVIFTMVIQTKKNLYEGKNTTGVFLNVPIKNQFDLLKKAVPSVKTIGVLYDPRLSEYLIDEARQEASNLGFDLSATPVNSPREVPGALRDLLPRVDALWMLPDPTVITGDSFKYIDNATFETRTPFLVFSEEFVKAGGLCALSPDYTAIGVQTAHLAESVFNGASPRRIPPAFPDKLDVVVNLKTAKEIGVKFSKSLLDAAKTY